MSIQESPLIHKALAGSLYLGMALDATKKIGTDMFGSYLLGHDTFLENHIGNFGTSAVLTGFVRNSVFNFLESQYDLKISNKLKNILAFTTIALLNIIVECPAILQKPNPEFIGDVSTGLLASLLFLMSFPKKNTSFLD